MPRTSNNFLMSSCTKNWIIAQLNFNWEKTTWRSTTTIKPNVIILFKHFAEKLQTREISRHDELVDQNESLCRFTLWSTPIHYTVTVHELCIVSEYTQNHTNSNELAFMNETQCACIMIIFKMYCFFVDFFSSMKHDEY